MLEVTRSLPRRRLSVRDSSQQRYLHMLITTDDAANAVRRVKGDFPGQDKEAKKAGEEGYEAVRSTAQQYVRLQLQSSPSVALTLTGQPSQD